MKTTPVILLLQTALLIALHFVVPSPLIATPTLASVLLYQHGTGGYNYYRIPALAVAGNGDLLAFAEGRNVNTDFGDIDIVLRRSSDHGVIWGTAPSCSTTLPAR